MVSSWHPAAAWLGGALIGASATLLLYFNGRIAGMSGMVGGVLARRSGDTAWRWLFLVGLLLGSAWYLRWDPGAVAPPRTTPVVMVLAGLLVGYGTRLGSGCTSGHGVCGLARCARRSVAATVTFLVLGMATVYVVRHVLGVAP